MHLCRYRAPKEQRQIIRIALAPFFFALISLAEIYNYSIARYIDPISSFYEAICLCALFLLYIQFAAPASITFGEDMFDAVKAQQEAGTKGKGNWPRNTWIAVFQYPIVEIIAIIITEATEAAGTYCASSLRPRFGHLWAMLIHSVGIVVAVLAIFRFYGRMKTLMKARRGLAKLVCFKVIVGLRFIQTVSSPNTSNLVQKLTLPLPNSGSSTSSSTKTSSNPPIASHTAICSTASPTLSCASKQYSSPQHSGTPSHQPSTRTNPVCVACQSGEQ
jgi:hypothetical protein